MDDFEFQHGDGFILDLDNFCRLSKPSPADAALLGDHYLEMLRARFSQARGHPPDARRIVGTDPVIYRTSFTGDAFVYYELQSIRVRLFARRTIVRFLSL